MTLSSEIVTGAVIVDGVSYPAEPIAGGAAYEVYSDTPAPGFLRVSTPSPWAYHRFFAAIELGLGGSGETVLQAPLSRAMSWERIHRLSQTPARDQHTADLLANVRATATVKRGTRMIKPLDPMGVTAVLKGQLPHGFCYRECDVAHLRTPAEQSVLMGQSLDEVSYLLRWRAVDPLDYQVPAGSPVAGLAAMPAHDRVGAPVLGTGFAPSSTELIPEWMTADFADLPLPANASLIAYVPDGTEVVLYTYQPEQRGWLRLVGPQWRHLLVPLREIPVEQEYIPLPRTNPASRLVGTFRGEEFEAIADPPSEFRVLAMTRAARYPVETLMRRTRFARWRGQMCSVLGADQSWARLRLCRPDPANVAALGATCYERGVYEVWAPAAEVTEAEEINLEYQI